MEYVRRHLCQISCFAAALAVSLPAAHAAPLGDPEPDVQPPAAALSPGFAPEGQQPYHIPPTLTGRIQDLSASRNVFHLPAGRGAPDPAAPVNVELRPYTEVHRLTIMDPGSLQHGDSVLIQGKADADGHTFTASEIIRTARQVFLAPGVALMDAAPPSDSVAPATQDALTASGPAVGAPPPPGAPAAPSSGSPAAANPAANALKAKLALREQQVIQRMLRQGRVVGLVVSANPLVVEIYNGQAWTIQTPEPQDLLTLDQVKVQPSALRDGDLVRVQGSEVEPGQFRAATMDIVPPDVALRLFQQNQRGRGRLGNGLRRFNNARNNGRGGRPGQNNQAPVQNLPLIQ